MKNSPNQKHYYKKILYIAAPMIIQNLAQHFQILIDRAWLGNLKVEYLSALGNATIPYFTIISFLMAASLGTTIIIAHRIGAKNIDAAKKYAEVSYLFSTLFSAALFFLWFFFAENIFTLLGTQGEILDYSSRYIKIITISLFFFGMDLTTVSILQGVGFTLPIMITGILKNLINVFLDWVLIFGNLGFPAMGLEGAAWATCIANISGTLILFAIAVLSKRLPFKLSFINVLKSKLSLYKDIFKIGFASGTEGLLWNLGQLFCIRILNEVDKMAAGIYTVVYGIQLIAMFIYLGIANSGTTLVGHKWGAGEYKEGIGIGLLCLKMALGICVAVSLIFALFPEPILRLFTQDGPTLEKCIPLLYFTAVIIYFQAANVIAGAAIRGTGNTKWMLQSQTFGTIFIVSLAAFFVFICKMGVAGMFVAMLADEVVRGFINLYKFLTTKNPMSIFIRFMQFKLTGEKKSKN